MIDEKRKSSLDESLIDLREEKKTRTCMATVVHDVKADETLLPLFRKKLEVLKCDKKSNLAELEALASSDEDLSRFLIARNNDLGKAYAMARGTIRYRSKFKPREIVVKDFPKAQAQGLYRLAGTTKDGCGILHATVANWDSFAYSVDEFVKFLTFHVELSLARNPQGGKIFFIFDVKKMGYVSDMRKLRFLARAFSVYYPERLSKAVFVNCDWAFDKLFNLCIRYLDKRTREKCVDFRDNAAEFLLQHIDADQLTEDLGGTREEEWPVEPIE